MEEREPDLDCSEATHEAHASVQTGDRAVKDPELTLSSDRSRDLREGARKAGYAVTVITQVLEVKALPAGRPAQRAELHALAQALTLSKDKRVTLHMPLSTPLLLGTYLGPSRRRGAS